MKKPLDEITDQIISDSKTEYITFFNRFVIGVLLAPTGFILYDVVIVGKDKGPLVEEVAEETIMHKLRAQVKRGVFAGKFPEYA